MADGRVLLWVLLGIAALLAAVVIGRALLYDEPSLEGLSPDAARIERLRLKGDVDGLAEELKGDDPAVAALAVRALGDLAPGALPHLERALEDPRPEVREAAAIALARAGALDKAPLLAAAAKDESATVRAAAVTALGRLGAVDEVPTLLNALSDDTAAVRRRAAEAIADITDIQFDFRADAPLPQRRRAEDQIRILWKLVEPGVRRRHGLETPKP